ncbi:hypothetical protein [Aestuariivirga litoralis]|uniref:hypothetical protein n=1 Tax=Aestuariivirga litoralis TaxID=2650924 RepID=UPI0018C5EC52|nr:hypothetical protein [Aestuariivirga litoralis]MBG1232130.1 hypothetical protein [Aestuariivirga litoralis]
MLKKLVAVGALAAAMLTGATFSSGSAKAHGWHDDHYCYPDYQTYFGPFYRPCHFAGGGWHIHHQPWWKWQEYRGTRAWYHHHRHHATSKSSTKCSWHRDWKHGHKVSVKVCKTIYW